MNILSFGASASKKSINKQFAHFVADQINKDELVKIDLLDYPLPIFTVDIEEEEGFPKNVHLFLEKINSSDIIVISMAEHNGSYTAWFKNLLDWSSRVNVQFLSGKKIILLSTSPGSRGGIGSLTAAKERFPRHGAEIIATFSLPNFDLNFSSTDGIINKELKNQLESVLKKALTK